MPNSGHSCACHGRRDASPGWKALQGVAALAGVPKPVIDTARAHLQALESRPRDTTSVSARPDTPQQFSLFDATPPALDALRALNPDTMSPREALDALYRLKSLA